MALGAAKYQTFTFCKYRRDSLITTNKNLSEVTKYNLNKVIERIRQDKSPENVFFKFLDSSHSLCKFSLIIYL